MKISIIGTGYVGLVTGIGLAEKGHSVVCVDLDEAKVKKINAGETPIYEPGLSQLLGGVIGSRLTATTDLRFAVTSTDLTFIAVGTPFNGRAIDLSFIRAAAAEIGVALREKSSYHTVVVKSTVVPGTTEEVVLPILEKTSGRTVGANLGLGMNPEFLSEGEAVHDFFNPDRIVLGGNDAATLAALAEVYASFKEAPVIRTSLKTAEMIKYASNALLATLISFSNEMANLCSELGGIDAAKVTEAVRLSQYLTPTIPNPPNGTKRLRAPIAAFVKEGCGFGGSCLPKDVKALIARGEETGFDMRLLKEVIRINEEMPRRMLNLLKKSFRNAPLKGVRVAVLGLAFKPDTDDLRESPALELIDLLLIEGAKVYAYDPIAMPAARKALVHRAALITYCASLEEAISKSEALFLVTAWKEFERIPELLNGDGPLVIDGRRMLDKTKIKNYTGIGL